MLGGFHKTKCSIIAFLTLGAGNYAWIRKFFKEQENNQGTGNYTRNRILLKDQDTTQ